jgi:hypothetical protein
VTDAAGFDPNPNLTRSRFQDPALDYSKLTGRRYFNRGVCLGFWRLLGACALDCTAHDVFLSSS